MTVKELIAELQKFDQDILVWQKGGYEDGPVEVNGAEVGWSSGSSYMPEKYVILREFK